jgi:hypothetical protein
MNENELYSFDHLISLRLVNLVILLANILKKGNGSAVNGNFSFAIFLQIMSSCLYGTETNL